MRKLAWLLDLSPITRCAELNALDLKSHIQLSGAGKKPLIRQPTSQRTFGRAESRWGLNLGEAPLSAISIFNWSPESTKAKRLFKAPRRG